MCIVYSGSNDKSLFTPQEHLVYLGELRIVYCVLCTGCPTLSAVMYCVLRICVLCTLGAVTCCVLCKVVCVLGPGGRPSGPTSMDGSDDDPRGGKGVYTPLPQSPTSTINFYTAVQLRQRPKYGSHPARLDHEHVGKSSGVLCLLRALQHALSNL